MAAVAAKIAIIVILVLTLGYILEVQLQPRINQWSNRFLARKPKPQDTAGASLKRVAAA